MDADRVTNWWSLIFRQVRWIRLHPSVADLTAHYGRRLRPCSTTEVTLGFGTQRFEISGWRELVFDTRSLFELLPRGFCPSPNDRIYRTSLIQLILIHWEPFKRPLVEQEQTGVQ